MNEAKVALRNWVLERNPALAQEALTDRTPLLKQRIITSFQLMDLILFLETLRGEKVDPGSLRPDTFENIDAIWNHFLQECS